jgi:hypothetical protein
MIRDEVRRLFKMGPLPAAMSADIKSLKRQQELLQEIKPPISDEEARLLCKLFGPDDCFGLAWSILHIVETAPSWPLEDCLAGASNSWLLLLADRAERGGKKGPSGV